MPRLRTLEEIMAMGVKVTIVNADGTTDQFIVKEGEDGTDTRRLETAR